MNRRLGKRGRFAALGTLVITLASTLLPSTAAQAATVRNLAPNPSVETRSGTRPSSWVQVTSGSNRRVFTYRSGGAHAGRRYVRTTVTQRTSGVAGWAFAPVAVRSGASYSYRDYYRGSASVLRARMTTTKGSVLYRTFPASAASRGWRAGGVTFTLPRGVTRLSMERVLTTTGTLDLDDVRLTLRSLPATPKPPAPAPAPAPEPTTPAPAPTTPAPVPATNGMVSITFDDGLTSQYDNAAPVLASHGLPATFYLISSNVGAGGYMSVSQAAALQGRGHELGSHSATHANLPSLSPSALTAELAGSKTALEANFGTIRSLAYPFGAYNTAVAAEAGKYYTTARTTDGGFNTRGAINRTALTMHYVLQGTDAATVAGWVEQAKNSGSWVILVYHGVAEGGDQYSVTPAAFAAQMAAVKASGIRAATVSAAYDAMS
ncbi:MAG: polysaccharide deacetylase family protein [Kineosporiaceae bacterium]|nr:polysaccharide deacetylase family protein [Kineosporiaceae bacterium]